MDLTIIQDLVTTKLVEYITNLDWAYILTVIIFSYFISKDQLITHTKLGKIDSISNIRPFLLKIPVVWRVFLFGIIYGIFLVWVRNYTGKHWVENMFNSLIFAMIFHKLFLNKLLNRLDAFIFPEKKKN